MLIENGIYKETITLKSNDVDLYNMAHPTHYFNLVQESAGSHAYHIGVSIPHLQKLDKTWLVTRTKMELFEYASWPGSIEVETWPQVPWKFYFPRGCRGYDKEKKLLFSSLSQWVILNLENQRIVKPDLITPLFGSTMQPEIFNPDLGSKIVFPTESPKDSFHYSPTLLYNNTDLNRHVNNVVYLHWMLDSLPFSFRDSYTPSEIDISFVAQTFRDDEVSVHSILTEEDGKNATLYHQVTRQENQVVATAKTVWKVRS